MGQVALGLRSLLVRLAIFVAMAALLAWALGGTLFPRAELTRIGESVQAAERSWQWEIKVGGKVRGERRFQLVGAALHDDRSRIVLTEAAWVDVAGPVALAGSTDRLAVAVRSMRDEGNDTWQILSVGVQGGAIERSALDDLAVPAVGRDAHTSLLARALVEIQLSRLGQGRPGLTADELAGWMISDPGDAER